MAFRGLFERLKAVAERFIPGLLREGASAQEVVSKLQEAGLGYGEEPMLSNVEEAIAEEARAQVSAPFDPGIQLHENFFRDRAWRTKWQYIYNFKYTYFDKTLGTEVEDYFAIARMDRVSLSDLSDEIQSVLNRIAESLRVKPENVELESGVHVVTRGRER